MDLLVENNNILEPELKPEKKIKIAILLSGRINEHYDQYENIRNNLAGDNDVDFFISYPKNTNSEIVQNVTFIYNPKEIIENDELYKNVDGSYNYMHANKHDVICMYLSRFNLGNIFKSYINKHNINYDIVISSRMDITFHEKLNLNDKFEFINNNFLYIPNIEHDHGGINDQMAIGNSNTIIQYLNLYEHINNILEPEEKFHPEILLYKYINMMNIDVLRFYIIYFIILGI